MSASQQQQLELFSRRETIRTEPFRSVLCHRCGKR
jgi:hypothetical protein